MGSLFKSDNTCTLIRKTSLSPYTKHLRLVIQLLCPFNNLPQPHYVTASGIPPLSRWQATKFGRTLRKKIRTDQKWARETQPSAYAPWPSTDSYLSRHCGAASIVVPLQPNANFTPSIQPSLGLAWTYTPLTSAINSLQAIRYLSLLSTCPVHLNIL